MAGGYDHIVMKMNAAFGDSGGAGGVEPKGGVVFGGSSGFKLGWGGLHELSEVCGSGRDKLRRSRQARQAGRDNFAERPKLFTRDGLQRRKKRIANDGHASATIVKDVFVVVGLGLGVDGNRNGADFDGAKEGVQKFGRIQQEEKDAFFPADAKREESVTGAIGLLDEFTIGDALLAAFDSDFGGAIFGQVSVDEKGSGIECRGKGEQGLIT